MAPDGSSNWMVTPPERFVHSLNRRSLLDLMRFENSQWKIESFDYFPFDLTTILSQIIGQIVWELIAKNRENIRNIKSISLHFPCEKQEYNNTNNINKYNNEIHETVFFPWLKTKLTFVAKLY